MSELKFRVWDNVDYMSTPFTLNDLQLKTIQFTPECNVMQFTGLKDKNGKDVYEGDVVKTNLGNIRYIKQMTSGEWIMGYRREGGIEGIAEVFTKTDRIEVIGNIYENPELIKKELF